MTELTQTHKENQTALETQKLDKKAQQIKELDEYAYPKSEFGPGRDPYSTFPEEAKAIIHQRLDLDPELVKQDLLKRIEEAKSKSLPIKFSEEDKQKYLKSREDVKGDESVVIIDPQGKEVLDQTGMNLD